VQREDYLQFINEEYEEIREDYYSGLKENKYVSLDEARRKKFQIDWTEFTPRMKLFFIFN
jgi:5-methyltetrahydrofolate--homocysteine methyltransferase